MRMSESESIWKKERETSAMHYGVVSNSKKNLGPFPNWLWLSSAERSLLIPEVRGSNPVIGKMLL